VVGISRAPTSHSVRPGYPPRITSYISGGGDTGLSDQE